MSLAVAAPAFAADPDPCVAGNDPNRPVGGGFPGTVMSADFDGDGTEDRACVLLADLDADGPVHVDVEFGPFDKQGYPIGGSVTLATYKDSKEFGDTSFGLVAPGVHQSLCVRGYDDCKYGEEGYAYTARPSVSLGTEGASWMYVYVGRNPANQKERLFRTFYLSD